MNARTAQRPVVEPDPCVVATEPLCNVVREFVEDWLKTRRSRKGQWESADHAGDVDPVSPYTWLAFDTGLPEPEIRKLRNPARYPVTELRVADAIVASIGNPVMFHDGTLEPRPNPAVPASRSAECCGGSLTGVLSRVSDWAAASRPR